MASNFDLVAHGRGAPAPDEARRRLQALELPGALGGGAAAAAKTYVPDEALLDAINTALTVGAPLLVTGEPGTGKTMCAHYVAAFFGVPLYAYQVRSTSTADDMKFDFDAVGYLRSAYEAMARTSSAGAVQNGAPETKGPDRKTFLTPRALWLAYKHEGPSVVLIDEIDKAPRDFPNDLLHELERHWFEHPFDTSEAARIGPPARPPIVVVTSNEERRLPDAFLRRCIVHRIELNDDLVRRAVDARKSTDFPTMDPALVEAAIQAFKKLRDLQPALQKKPATAELLVWLTVLAARRARVEEVRGPLGKLPALSALIKLPEDRTALEGR